MVLRALLELLEIQVQAELMVLRERMVQAALRELMVLRE
jgi:hypothetical protein